MSVSTYNSLKKFFPSAFKFSEDIGLLIVGLIIHLIGLPVLATFIGTVIGFVFGITIILAPIGILIAGVIGFVLGTYGWIAAVLEVLLFAKVIKAPEVEEDFE